MARPKNSVTLTKANKAGTAYDIYYFDKKGQRRKIKASTTTILRGVLGIRAGLLLDK